MQESHVAYEEGSSVITSPAGSDNKSNDQTYRLNSKHNRSKMKNDIKDIIELNKSCVIKNDLHVPMNESVMKKVIEEESDSECASIRDIIKKNSIVGLCLDQDTKKSLQIQQLKKSYREFVTSFKYSEGYDEYKVSSNIK